MSFSWFQTCVLTYSFGFTLKLAVKMPLHFRFGVTVQWRLGSLDVRKTKNTVFKWLNTNNIAHNVLKPDVSLLVTFLLRIYNSNQGVATGAFSSGTRNGPL